MGRMWGSSRFMSQEEFTLGVAIDEITNVYPMGAVAFALFGGESSIALEVKILVKCSDGIFVPTFYIMCRNSLNKDDSRSHDSALDISFRKNGEEMSLAASVAPLLTHLAPIVYFIYLLSDMLSRNRRRTEYLLVSGIVVCCLSLFLEEFVRHYLPIEYSPIITASWFDVAGITIVGLGLHLFIRLTNMEHRFPRFVYPYLFYLPTVLVILNLFFNDQMVSGNVFYQTDLWKMPVYNSTYYIAILGSNLINVVYILILWKGIVNTGQRELRAIYRQLIYGVLITMFFNLTIGVIDFKGHLPPYPYIYGTLVWCVLLRVTMRKYAGLEGDYIVDNPASSCA